MLAEELIRAAGLEGRIRVYLLDYREIPAEFEKAFDAFISLEMLEVCLLPPKRHNAILELPFSTLGPNTTTLILSLSTSLSNLEMQRLLFLPRLSRNRASPVTSE